MIQEELADDATMNEMAHLVSTVLPQSLGENRCTLAGIRGYVKNCMLVMEKHATVHPPAKDGQREVQVTGH